MGGRVRELSLPSCLPTISSGPAFESACGGSGLIAEIMGYLPEMGLPQRTPKNESLVLFRLTSGGTKLGA